MPWTSAVLLGHLLMEHSHNSRRPSRPHGQATCRCSGQQSLGKPSFQPAATTRHVSENSDDRFGLSLWSPADAAGRRKRLSLLSSVQFADS